MVWVQDQIGKTQHQAVLLVEAQIWTKGVYSWVHAQDMKTCSYANVTSFSLQIFMVSIQGITPPNFRNRSSSLGRILSPKVKIHDRVCWTPDFLDQPQNSNSHSYIDIDFTSSEIHCCINIYQT